MASPSVLNPDIPYVGEVPGGGLEPGKMLKLRGKSPPDAVRFAINYQLGPNINPRDDIAIHLSLRFPEGFVTRNSIERMQWGPEENNGPMWIQPGQQFEIIILCEQLQYKIAINGRHFTEFAHRLPYKKVTHLVIDGDVEIESLSYESITSGPPRSPRSVTVPDIPEPNFGPPAPGGLYPTLGPQGLGPVGGGGYGGPTGPGYDPPRTYGYQPGYDKPEEEDAFGGCLDKVGLAVGGLIAAGGVAAAMHAYNKKKHEQESDHHEKTDVSKSETESGGGGDAGSGLNLGALGAALASSLASNALQGDMRSQSAGYPPNDSAGPGGVLGSILGAIGGGSSQHGQGYPQQAPSSDPFGGALGSILGGVLGGGGSSGSGGHQQPAGGYRASGGYGSQQQDAGGDLLSGLGSALGSSLFSSALDGLTKRKSQGDDDRHNPAPPQNYGNYGNNGNFGNFGIYGGPNEPVSQPPHEPTGPPPRPSSPSSAPSSGRRFNASDISKGLGLGDDEE